MLWFDRNKLDGLIPIAIVTGTDCGRLSIFLEAKLLHRLLFVGRLSSLQTCGVIH